MTSTALTWKGRFIVTQDGSVDLPHDRQSIEGEGTPKERVEFLNQLDAALPSNALFKLLASKLRSREINTREAAEVILLDDEHDGEHWLVTANSNGSAGYCYVQARIVVATPSDEEKWQQALDAITETLEAMSEYDRNDAIEALRSRFDEIYTRNGNDED